MAIAPIRRRGGSVLRSEGGQQLRSLDNRLAGESLKGAWGHDGLQRSSRARDRSHRRARVNRLAWDHATAFVLRPRRRTRRARVDRGKPLLSYPRRARTRSDATPGRLARFRSSPLSRKSRSDVGSRSVRLRFGRRSPEFLWRSARSSRWATDRLRRGETDVIVLPKGGGPEA